ncbi:metallophosphoesterase family protein [Chryseolinea sp. T2]|uniref:metallophosphoesterase family protein n=1 Tax=Chryseolinea sp. T2 TaxID=3129255 RepID=UPI0030787A9C
MSRKHSKKRIGVALLVGGTILSFVLYTGFLREVGFDGSPEGHDHSDVYHEESHLHDHEEGHTHSHSGDVSHDEDSEHEEDHEHNDGHHADHEHSHAAESVSRQFYATPEPDRVILNVTETPEKSLAINWRTDTTVVENFLEWAVATSGPEFQANVSRVPARKETLRVKHGDEPVIRANYFSAELNNLTPGARYVYRVGSSSGWSEWHQVRMPRPDRLAFIYFGDAQNDIKSLWSRVIREAYKTTPDVDFMLHAGDLINRHDHDLEWGEWFYAGNFIHATIPGVMTPGNHEYGTGVKLSPNWRPQFNLPKNGPKGLEETCYVVNYSNLKVISLDAEQIDESPYYQEKQARWLDSVLTNDPRKWTAVTLHYPFFSTKPNRDNEKLRGTFKPILDKHRVDIVLQGHDHAYGRGMVNNVTAGAGVKDTKSGTMYVVSVSGPKMYDVSNDPWMQRKARNTQLFQIISIEGDKLTYQAYTASGELYDAFDLIKSGKKPNKVVNRIPATPERQ